MADIKVNWPLLRGLGLSLLSGILIKESLAFYQNTQKSLDIPPPAPVSKEYEDNNPSVGIPEISPPEPAPSSPKAQTPAPSDRWSIQLPSESALIANYEQWWTGALTPAIADQPQRDDAIALSPVPLESSSAPALESLETAQAPPQAATRIKAIGNQQKQAGQIEPPLTITQAPVRTVTSGSLSPDSTPENPEPFQPSALPVSAPTQTPVAASPTATIMIPSAYGQQWGKVGVALGVQSRTRYTDHADAGFGIGIGLGNPQTAVGVDVGVSIVDLVGDTAQDGAVSVKVHRQLPQNWAIAVGVHNALQWGDTDGGSSVYGVVTKRFDLSETISDPFSRVYVSAGVGGGQFRSEDNIMGQNDGIEVFGGVAVRVIPSVNAIAEWTGQNLTLGASVVPFSNLPLVLTPAVTDLTGSAGDGSRFILGIGYVFSF